MLHVYLFALIFGGVLVGASALLGGKDGSGDGGGHAGGYGKDMGPLEAGGGAAAVLGALRSLRFWTFALAFFGASGLLLDGLDLAGELLSALVAIAMGLGSGALAAWVMRKVGGDALGAPPSSVDFVGRTGRVLVPVEKGRVGKVRVELQGKTVDVLATTEEDRAFDAREEAIIIEMGEDGRARIARLAEEPRRGDPVG
ncbi:MAG: hypothetical protein NZ898_08900 [Myxococcota bacterium]|nr:hypothetical protein [Myxococcota bacterium]MDW8363795.1 hypothetical protein [Myxococcales bacterium]